MDNRIFRLAKLAQDDGALSPNTRRIAAGVGSALASFLMAKYLMKIEDVPAQLAVAGAGGVLGVGADEFVRSRDVKVPSKERIEERKQELETAIKRDENAAKAPAGVSRKNLADRTLEGISTGEGAATNASNLLAFFTGLSGLKDLRGVENAERAKLRHAIKAAGPASFDSWKSGTPTGMTELQNAAMDVYKKKGTATHNTFSALNRSEPSFVMDNIKAIQSKALKQNPAIRDRKLLSGSAKMTAAPVIIALGQMASNWFARDKVKEALEAGELVLKQQPKN